jgi:hypothetical protein
MARQGIIDAKLSKKINGKSYVTAIQVLLLNDKGVKNNPPEYLIIPKADWNRYFKFETKSGTCIYKNSSEAKRVEIGDGVTLKFIKDPKQTISNNKAFLTYKIGSSYVMTAVDYKGETKSPPSNNSKTAPKDEDKQSELTTANSEWGYKVKIGASVFDIPPIAIDVTNQTSIERVQTLRSNGSLKTQSGHSNIRVEFSLYFQDVDNINDPVDGLRGLVAQFKRAPFLPVTNHYLNSVHKIFALTLSNMVITTVPGFPNDLQVKLTCYKFNHTPYVPGYPFLEEILDHELFKWYYMRNLIYKYENGKPMPIKDKGKVVGYKPGRLKEIPDTGMTNDLHFYYVPLESLVKSKNKNSKVLDDAYAETLSGDAYASTHDMRVLKDVKTLLNMVREDRGCDAMIAKHDMNGYIKRVELIIENKLFKDIRYIGNTSAFPPKDIGKQVMDPEGKGITGHLIEIALLNPNNIRGLKGEKATSKNGKYYVRLVFKGVSDIQVDVDKEDVGKVHSVSPRTMGVVYNINKNAPRTDISAFESGLSRWAKGNAMEVDFTQDMDEWFISDPDQVVITNATVAFENLITDLQLESMDSPTHQYLGSQDVFLKLDFRTTSEKAVDDLRDLFAYSMNTSRDFKNSIKAGFIKIKHDIANLFGVEYVLIDQFNVNTVPGLPGTFDIEMVLIDFDVMQRRIERAGGIIGTADSSSKFVQINGANHTVWGNNRIIEDFDLDPDTETLRKNLQTSGDAYVKKVNRWISINDMFKYFEIYPDLELPTWRELKNAGNDSKGNPLFTHVRWLKLPKSGEDAVLASWNGTAPTPNGGIFVDPDFYYIADVPQSEFLKKQLEAGASVTMVDMSGSRARIKVGEKIQEIESASSREVDKVLAEIKKDQDAADKAAKKLEEQAAEDKKNTEAMLDTLKDVNFSKENKELKKQAVDKILNQSKVRNDKKEIEWRIKLAHTTDNAVRLKAWPPIPQMIVPLDRGIEGGIKGVLAEAGSGWLIDDVSEMDIHEKNKEYQQRIHNTVGQIAKEYGSLDTRTLGAMWMTESSLTQLYLEDSNSHKRGQPLQTASALPVFGVAQVNLDAHKNMNDFDGKPVDVVKIVYDYEYNMRIGAMILDGKYKAFRKVEFARIKNLYDDLFKPRDKKDPKYFPRPWSDFNIDDFMWGLAAVYYLGCSKGPSYILDVFEKRKKNSTYYKRWQTIFGRRLDQWLNWSPLNISQMQKFNNEQTNAAQKYAAADEYNAYFAEIGKYKQDDPQYGDKSPLGYWHDYIMTDCSNRMIRAFPTYHLILIDEGRNIRWWKMWDNFYGMSAVSDISIYKSRKNISDVCTISMSNIYGGINNIHSRGAQSNLDEVKRSTWETWNPVQGPTDTHLIMRDRLEPRLMLAPGSRISLRIGYGANASKLPLAFNGTITELEVGEVVNCVAQGDGVELSSKVPYGNKSLDGVMSFGSEPRNLILGLMLTRSSIKEAIHDLSGGRWFDPEEDTNIVHFGHSEHHDIRHFVQEMGENIYPATFKEAFTEGPTWNPFNWFANTPDEANICVDSYDRTVWDMIQTCALAMPNYIAAVVPVGFRSTLFYGMPHWGVVYDWDITAPNKKKLGDADVRRKRKPFQQWHTYNSLTDIIDNSIRVTSSDMYTNVIGTYKTSTSHVLGSLLGKLTAVGWEESGAHEDSVTAYADRDIYAHLQRTTQIYTNIRCDGNGFFSDVLSNMVPLVGFKRTRMQKAIALAVAQSSVRDYMKDMYDGEMIVLGDPSVKPYDSMYIWDKMSDMFGICEVKEVIHHLSFETGFITSIKPDLCVAVADPHRHDMWGWGASLAVGAVLETITYGAGKAAVKSASKFAESAYDRALSLFDEAADTASGLGRGAKEGIAKAIGKKGGAAAAKSWESVSGVTSKIAQFAGDLITLALTAGSIAGAAGAGIEGLAAMAVGAGVMAIGVQSIANWIKEEADKQSCIVANFLTYRGREFSAGVLGHDGIVIGEVDQWFKHNWINKGLTKLSKAMNGKGILPQWLQGTNVAEFDAKATIYNAYYGKNITEAGKAINKAHLIAKNRSANGYAYTSEDDMDYANSDSFTYLNAPEQDTDPNTPCKKFKYDGKRITWQGDIPKKYRDAKPVLVDAIDDFMSRHTQYSIKISSTREPGRPDSANHKAGKAIDVNFINDWHIGPHCEGKKATLQNMRDLVKLNREKFKKQYQFWKDLVKYGGWRELIGPWGYYRAGDGMKEDLFDKLDSLERGKNKEERDKVHDTQEWRSAVSSIMKVMGAHFNHIHIARH